MEAMLGVESKYNRTDARSAYDSTFIQLSNDFHYASSYQKRAAQTFEEMELVSPTQIQKNKRKEARKENGMKERREKNISNEASSSTCIKRIK